VYDGHNGDETIRLKFRNSVIKWMPVSQEEAAAKGWHQQDYQTFDSPPPTSTGLPY